MTYAKIATEDTFMTIIASVMEGHNSRTQHQLQTAYVRVRHKHLGE